MFNMTKIRATNGSGKSFYANHLCSNDYYSEHEKVQGYWRGELADAFGLRDKVVTSEEFSLFQRNVNPKTPGKLTQKNMPGGPRFFDFQVAAPKSVSVMSMFDERLIEAHRESVRIAMAELERLAAVRVRDGENVRTNNYETTGKLVYAEFMHDTSRALDPQLHTHNVVCNVTRAGDGRYKALETLEMCRAIRYAGKVYHNEMAARCRELGYETVETRDRKGNVIWYDLACVPADVMERFSKRRQQIEKAEAEFIAEHGRKPTLSENNYLSTSTRTDKMLTSTSEKVREFQMAQLGHREEAQLYAAAKRAKEHGSSSVPLDRERIIEQVRNVIGELYERESVLKLDKILAEVLNRNLGRIKLQELKKAVKEIPELRNLGGNAANPYYAPEVVIERELSAIGLVDQQRDVFDAIAPEFQAFPGDRSREAQAMLIHGLLSSKDRFNLFRGVAGAGKTSTLQEFCKGLRSGDVTDIHLVTPTNSATDVLKQEGFEQSQTVAGFLLSKQKPPAGAYVIIDESGLNSLREGVEILKLARKNNYRVLFVGDARQHSAVESGDFFRLLEDYSQIQKFSLTDIHRQQNAEYRRGIFECAMGQHEQAFERFDKQHFIHEGKQKYLEEAAGKYMEYTEQGRYLNRAILVAPTHEECDKLTASVRAKLKEAEVLRGAGRETEVFRSWNKPKAWLKDASNFQPGMTIGFIRNMKGVGKAGEVTRIEAVEGKQLVLANGKRIFAKGASDFIDVGEMRKIELCEGDLIQFRVNLKAKKIYNGTLARVSADPGKVEILYSDGRPRKLIDMPENYAAFDYGWVTTSHKSQGRTAENVVVAAESLDRKAFYVALSRGRREMSLHCPDKEHLKRGLAYRTGERASIHDLIRDREIPAGAMLPLSEPVRERKAELLPDFSYKDMAARAKTAMRKVKAMLSDTATLRRMRQHRERLYNEHTRFETEEHAVGLLGKVVSRITGMFRTPEAVPQESPQADWERECEAERQQNLELARKRELEAQWNVFEGAWSGYVEKRKHYHELHGGGEAFELTDREAAFRKQQTTRQRHGKAPQPLPAWLEKWEDTARTEAEKSRAALAAQLEEAKRLKTAWEKADAEWAAHCTARKAYHAELGFKVPFRLWDKEYRYHTEQKLRRRRGEFPQPMPESLVSWKAYMDEQKQQELRMFWNEAQKQWEELLASRRAVYEKQHVEAGFRLWPEEEAFAAAQQERRAAGLKPEAIPAELCNWRERAVEEVQQLVEVAARQRRYEAEAQWKWKWQDFDEKWKAYVKNRIKPSRLEPIFQEEIELRRNSHREPPSIIELPDWMKIEEVLDIHERNLKIEEIRRKLGLHPGDEGQSVDPDRKLYYESKREELFRRIAVYDQRTAFEKLPDWMKKWNPSEAHKAKVRNAIYMKYDCNVADEKSLEPLEWLELQNRKIKAKAEYAAYEHQLAVGPATDRQMDELKSFAAAGLLKEWPAEPDREEAEKLLEQLREWKRQQKLAEERRRNPMADWQSRTLRELHEEGRLEKIPENISSREASELIDRITFHDPASWMMKNAVRRNIESGLLPSSAGRNLDGMTVGEFRKIQKVIMEKQQEIDRRREQWEREHPRDRGGIDL
ncbi:MobF family relaxase [uncultured Victivallis sp.]|uniref:MobF family relaxase n=1 Tax=uncultured Victivallis sp. TaxID=354118 RepID=UPI002587CFAB|nr:MobF family relaxase [uncultured Victivallis sp.]